MEDSILKSTKQTLGIAPDYTAFDLEIITFINSAFSSLTQLGVTSAEGFLIDDESKTWTELGLSINELSMVKTYIYLKARLIFDPPTTGFLLEAINKQITEHEWRLTNNRETHTDDSYVVPVVEEEVI